MKRFVAAALALPLAAVALTLTGCSSSAASQVDYVVDGALSTYNANTVVGAASAGGGALFAKLVDTGVKDDTIQELRNTVPPGKTAVALLVSHVSVADLQRELTRFPNAALVETDLPDASVAAVQNALAEANREPFTG